jgi:transposase
LLGVSRNTVRKLLSILEEHGVSVSDAAQYDYSALQKLIGGTKSPERSERRQEFDRLLPELHSQLGRKHVTMQLLWEEYRFDHPDGYGYTQFCKYLGSYTTARDVTACFDHEPGELTEVDFAGDKMYSVNPETGEVRSHEVILCTLPFSKYFYMEALEAPRMDDFLGGLTHAASFFGGVTKLYKFDNARVAVTKPDRYSPDFTHALQQFSEHYQITCTAARVRKPRDKPSVEGSVNWGYTRIYARMRNNTYTSVAEINADIRKYLDEFLGRKFQRRDETRHELFVNKELPHLLPLPKEPFRLKKVREVTVRPNSYVIVSEDNHFYSVPYEHVGKKVRVVYDTHFVEVYLHYDRIATHVRSRANLGYTTNRDHLPPHLIAVYNNRAMTADDFLDRARAIGPNATIVLERIIASKAFPAQTHRSCEGFLHLAAKFGKDVLEQACQVAADRPGWSSYSVVRDLIKRGPLETPIKPFRVPPHKNVRGAAAYT